MEIAKVYEPKLAEEKHYERWERMNCFAPEINQNPEAKPFSIVIPPPNVTGSLHMGHALQHTLMDVLTRRKRMQGFRALWLPGTDHAGISTQLQVTKKLFAEEKKTRWDVGREDFMRRMWDWKAQYEHEIKNQIRREGASVDWSRERFTLDDDLSQAVRKVFVTLYEEGNIYRGRRIVNWCPRDRTVLSDLEVREDKKPGKLVYLQYPIVGTERKLTVATTRPETMLGDAAVAVNPNDERYRDLIGKMILLPLTSREIPVIADDYVDPEFGTGAVKITPAHDPNDYEVGLRHNLPQFVVMNDDATMNENAGPDFRGLDRYAARTRVVERFEELGLLEKQEDYEISLPLCERCETVLEPTLSLQWFVRMNNLRDLALDSMRNEQSPRFVPEVPYEKTYTAWLENLKDWTISRQLWWGHQIPAWYDAQGNVFVARNFAEAAEKAGTTDLVQDEDVLDTWFSSGLWAFSTFGWDGETVETPDLNTFLPTDVLVTGRDIIYLWVSRMVMLTLKFTGKKPFHNVLVTGTVVDKNGQKMAKTKGNVVNPLDIFDKFGVDATRIYLAGAATGADIRLNETLIETYRNFANKIWNASRFCLMNSEGAAVDYSYLNPQAEVAEIRWARTGQPDDFDEEDEEFLDKIEPELARDNPKENLSIADRWIVSRLNRTAIEVNRALDRYFFHEAVRLLYQFFWNDFCDWYIELVKDEITGTEPNVARDAARFRILTVLEQSLRLLHPFMPFLTEELWQMLPGTSADLHNPAYSQAEKTIMLADFPAGDATLIDDRAESEMQAVIELISKVRNIRAEMNIRPSERVEILLAANSDLQQVFAQNEAQILKLARVNNLQISETLAAPKASARAALSNGAEIAVPLEGLIDFAKETERVEKELLKLNAEVEKLNAQLANENFVSRAPAEKVEDIRLRVADIEQRTKTLNQTLEALR